MRRAWRSRRPDVKTQSATIAPRIRRVGDSRCLTSDGAKRYLSAAPRLSPIARRRDCDGAPRNGTKRAHGRRRCEENDMRRLGQQVVARSEEHTSELQSRENLVCRLLLEKKKKKK